MEIIKQLNKKGVASEAVVVRQLPSSNIVLAIDIKRACTS